MSEEDIAAALRLINSRLGGIEVHLEGLGGGFSHMSKELDKVKADIRALQDGALIFQTEQRERAKTRAAFLSIPNITVAVLVIANTSVILWGHMP